jgi:hypothetical protein
MLDGELVIFGLDGRPSFPLLGLRVLHGRDVVPVTLVGVNEPALMPPVPVMRGAVLLLAVEHRGQHRRDHQHHLQPEHAIEPDHVEHIERKNYELRSLLPVPHVLTLRGKYRPKSRTALLRGPAHGRRPGPSRSTRRPHPPCTPRHSRRPRLPRLLRWRRPHRRQWLLHPQDPAAEDRRLRRRRPRHAWPLPRHLPRARRLCEHQHDRNRERTDHRLGSSPSQHIRRNLSPAVSGPGESLRFAGARQAVVREDNREAMRWAFDLRSLRVRGQGSVRSRAGAPGRTCGARSSRSSSTKTATLSKSPVGMSLVRQSAPTTTHVGRRG